MCSDRSPWRALSMTAANSHQAAIQPASEIMPGTTSRGLPGRLECRVRRLTGAAAALLGYGEPGQFPDPAGELLRLGCADGVQLGQGVLTVWIEPGAGVVAGGSHPVTLATRRPAVAEAAVSAETDGVTRRPPPTRAAAHDAAARIVDRRTAAHDPHLSRLGDDLLGVLEHVAAHHSARDLAPDVIRADVADAAVIRAYLAGRLDRLHLAVLVGGRDEAGMSYGDLAAAEGLPDRRHAHDLVMRLTAAAAGEVKRGTEVRRRRRVAADERAVLERNVSALWALASALAAAALPEDLGDEAGVDVAAWRDEVAALPAGGPVPHLVAVELRLLVAELARWPGLDADLRSVVETGAQICAVAVQ